MSIDTKPGLDWKFLIRGLGIEKEQSEVAEAKGTAQAAIIDKL